MVDVNQKYSEMPEDRPIFSYAGLLTMDLIVQLMKLTNTILTMHEVKTKQKKSIINAMIEALQNSLYHADQNTERNDQTNECFIFLLKEETNYCISTGNYIENEHIPKLQTRIGYLTPLTIEELNIHYLDTLGKGEISDKGGAGLGLIRILQASKMQTTFGFKPFDHKYSVFNMNIIVSA
ncbi:MAG: SiaB family protein kinase [Bacteroidota bacterium]